MTGAEHYREAENLIRIARDDIADDEPAMRLLAEAQVHATLALAASTAALAIENGATTAAETADWGKALDS